MFKKLSTESLVVIIICLSFFIGWFITFGIQTFFNPQNVMIQTYSVPSLPTIGYDLNETIKSSKELLLGRTPYVLKIYSYTPFASVLFVPLTFLKFKVAYLIVFLATIACFALSMLLVRKVFETIDKDKGSLVLFLYLLLTGMTSYGMAFELERGQFNVLALVCAIIGIYFFSNSRKVLGLVFVTLGIQLKIYPAIFFILFFIHSFKVKKDWLLAGSTVLVNFLLLFVAGPTIFKDFVEALLYQMKNAYYWIGNHSLVSYCDVSNTTSFCTAKEYPILLIGYIAILLTTMILTLKFKTRKVNPYLFTICGLGMLIIPSASHDYTLAMLPIILYPVLKEFYNNINVDKIRSSLLLTLTLTAYSTTLFSTYHIPPLSALFDSKTPALIILILLTFSAALFWGNDERIKLKESKA